MQTFLVLLPLLGAILGVESKSLEGLDPKVPIYLGNVFWPPSMTFIAWLPSEPKEPPPKVHIPGLTKEDNGKDKAEKRDPMLDVNTILVLSRLSLVMIGVHTFILNTSYSTSN